MLSFSEIRKLRKREKASIYIEINREIGLVLTWVLLNMLPSVSANSVTASMLVLNIISAYAVYRGITLGRWVLLVAAFLLFNLSICLDCVDGNIARFRHQQSVYGVFLDRVVHNISYPLLYFAVGVALYYRTDSLVWLLVCFATGILLELSPITVALENVENLFTAQLLKRKTEIYSIHDYSMGSRPAVAATQKKSLSTHMSHLVGLLPFWNQLFIAVLLDISFLGGSFLITKLHVCFLGIRRLLGQLRRVKHEISLIEDRLQIYSD